MDDGKKQIVFNMKTELYHSLNLSYTAIDEYVNNKLPIKKGKYAGYCIINRREL